MRGLPSLALEKDFADLPTLSALLTLKSAAIAVLLCHLNFLYDLARNNELQWQVPSPAATARVPPSLRHCSWAQCFECTTDSAVAMLPTGAPDPVCCVCSTNYSPHLYSEMMLLLLWWARLHSSQLQEAKTANESNCNGGEGVRGIWRHNLVPQLWMYSGFSG